jgi:Spy/CpxP family protein refolding chaperone
MQRERGEPPADLPRILRQLDLTDEQKEKVEKWMKAVIEKRETAEKKVQEAVAQVKQNQDREKIRDILQAHAKEKVKLQEDLLGKVQGVLTSEQKRRFVEVQRHRPERPMPGLGQLIPPLIRERLGLTPEQREKVAKLQKESEEKLRGILTDEQNQKFEALKKGRVPPERP